MNEPTCPTCRRPKTASNKGSLTQWITVCSCDLKAPDNLQASSLHFCRTCGKRIGEGRPGSFTQYIFRFDTCRCEFPEAALPSSAQAPDISIDNESEFIDDEPVLEELPGPFPIDRYKPLAVLGQGSSGIVYLGRDRLLRKKVAVKVLRGLNPLEVVAFQKEARATSKLKHPGIVTLLDFGLIDTSIPYMVLEYVSGLSIKDTLAQRGTLQWQACVFIARRLCEALGYAHAQGIFHRDLQPSNIIITREPDDSSAVKLIDFGIAKSVREATGSLQPDDVDLVGTPFYMSPDQGFGHQYDARSEVYSLACVLFECLTGSPPFQGETALETLSMHARNTPPTLREAYQNNHSESAVERLDCPELLDAVLQKCLAKKQEERYQSMAALEEALRHFSADFIPIGEVENVAERRREPSKPVLRRSIIFAVLTCCVGLICVFGAIAYMSVSNHTPDHDQPKPLRPNNSIAPVAEELAIRNVLGTTEKNRSFHFKNAKWANEIKKENVAAPSDLPRLAHSAAVAASHKNFELAIRVRKRLCAAIKESEGISMSLIAQTYNLSSNLFANKQREEADEELQRVIDYADQLSKMNKPLSKSDTAHLVAPAWSRLAISAWNKKDYSLCETRMKKAIELLEAGPDHTSKKYHLMSASCHAWLAHANWANHHYDEAIANQTMSVEFCEKFKLPSLEPYRRVLTNYRKLRTKMTTGK